MKKSGDLCKLDALGRIVIPVRLRRRFDLNVNDPLEIYTNEDEIILRKYIPACIFCGSNDDLVTYMNKCVCGNCVKEIGK